MVDELTLECASRHAGGRARFDHPDGVLGAGVEAQNSAVRLHDERLPLQAVLSQGLLQSLEVGGDRRADVRVENRRRGALVLADEWGDLTGERVEGVRQ